MAHRKGRQVVHPVGQEGGHRPGQGCPEVVADHVGPIDPQLVQHGDDVAGRGQDVVGLDALGRARGAVAAQVRDDHPEAGVGQSWNLVAPHGTRVGESVEEHDRAPAACHLHVDGHAAAVDLHGLVLSPDPQDVVADADDSNGRDDRTDSEPAVQRLSPEGKWRELAGAPVPPCPSGHRVVTDLSRVLKRTPSIPWMWASPNRDCFHPPKE
jgi:hypothetical protein